MNFIKSHICDTILAIICVINLVFVICISIPRENYCYKVFHDKNCLEMEAVKCSIVHEIDNYIQTVAPSSSVNGLAIFEACQEYDVDIIFVLAQGQIESHYGTTGVAAKTNSIFNVYAYDGRSADDMNKRGHGYDHPDKSIRPYLKLLTEQYLNGKTEKDMFKKFTNINGQRYATDTGYENKLYNTYQKIDSATNISSLMTEYNKYKVITNAK